MKTCHGSLAAVLLVWGAGTAGCQHYAARPPELAAHQTDWLARSPGDERVMQYAEKLRTAGALESAFDVSDGVTLAEAEVVALVLNADLRETRAKAGVAAATEANAGLWEDPTLGVDVMHVLANVQHQWMAGASVGFTIPISGRLAKEKALAEAQHVAALQRVAQREWETVTALREAWLMWSATREKLAVTREFLDELEGLVNIVEEMLEAGEMNRLETRLFQIEELSGRQELASLEGMRDQQAIEIHRLMGLAPTAEVQLVPTVAVEPSTEDSLAIEALLVERNPMLQTLLAEYESAERALALEIRKQYPDINIGPAYQYEDGTNRVGIGVSFPLPILNANRLAIARARAERERAMAALERALESILTQLAAADVKHATAATRRRIVSDDIVPLVDAQFRDAREVARLGEVDTLLLLETLRKRYDTKLQLITLIRDESAAVVEREHVIGPEPIPPPPPKTDGATHSNEHPEEVQS